MRAGRQLSVETNLKKIWFYAICPLSVHLRFINQRGMHWDKIKRGKIWRQLPFKQLASDLRAKIL